MANKYDKEFKVMISELVISGQSVKNISEEYGIDPSTVRKWKKAYQSPKEAFTGSGIPSLSAEEKEIRRLKKALREAELERDILKKAVAIFSSKDRPVTNL